MLPFILWQAMDNLIMSQDNTHVASQASRRQWARAEEDFLIVQMKELLKNGWKSDNGFKAGYLIHIENALEAKLPGCGLKGNKHITSKLTVWKRTYYIVQNMVATSGFGWNASTNNIFNENDVWIQYVKAHPEADKMRYRSYPYYNDWCEIFGKDRATGEYAVGPDDATKDNKDDEAGLDDTPLTGESVTNKSLPGDKSQLPQGTTTIELSDDGASSEKEKLKRGRDIKSKPSVVKKTTRRRVGDRFEAANLMIVNLMEKFIEKQALGIFADKLIPSNEEEKSQIILNACQAMHMLPPEARILVGFKIINNPKITSMFINLDDHSRFIFAQMLLSNKTTF